MNKRRLVEYYMEVLDKISFADRRTFRKELRKAFRNLLPEERAELKIWFRNACMCKLHPTGQEIALQATRQQLSRTAVR